jgi:hypothetical protein
MVARVIKGLNSPSVEIDRYTRKFKLTIDAWRTKGGRGRNQDENVILEFDDLSYAELECVGFTIADALLEHRNRAQQGLDDLRDRYDS